ncbi:efflux RND transporter periplasmic adaptor subunit [Brevibacillus sp. SYSU BS000544]|uniref:efflux RND transporter periplasmic adaptor subunit n=1 Tax=Brevibacillus sp. SYSU BS000544 TaxID=3416443 RepID=UPI003CE4EF5C
MKRAKLGIAVVLSALLLVTGCTSKDAPSTTEEKITPVQIETAATGTVELESGITGKLAPSQEVKISPKVSGKIKSFNVTLGQMVTQGQVLFTLDQTDLVNAVQQAEAGYKLALANLQQSQSSSGQGVEQAKNSLAQAGQALEDARRNEQRMNLLFQQGAISLQQFEQTKLALVNAQTAYANAQKAYDTAKQFSVVTVSEASVSQAKVSLENAREQLANASVTAPISGYVASVNGAVGEMAAPQGGAMAVVTIVKTDPLKVKVNLSEAEIGKVKVGSNVNVEIEALNKTITASVTAVSPVMDQTQKAYPVEISISNPGNELKPDIVVKVKFMDEKNTKQALVISRKAVFEQEGKKYVYKVDGEVAKLVEVTSGKESSDTIEILSGIAAGDKIVVRGQTLLQDGAKVKVQSDSK